MTQGEGRSALEDKADRMAEDPVRLANGADRLAEDADRLAYDAGGSVAEAAQRVDTAGQAEGHQLADQPRRLCRPIGRGRRRIGR
jgi:hypothetical protein